MSCSELIRIFKKEMRDASEAKDQKLRFFSMRCIQGEYVLGSSVISNGTPKIGQDLSNTMIPVIPTKSRYLSLRIF